MADGPTPGGSTACATGMVNNGGGATIYNYGTIVLNNTGCTEGLFNNNLSNIYNFGTIDTRPSTGSDAAVNAGFILNECSGIILGPPGIVNGYTQASPCGPTNSALEFPLGVAALFLLLVPLLIILRKRESSLSGGRNQTLLLQ